MVRREIPLIITMGVGWFMVMEFFSPMLEPISTELQSWAIIMTALASALGVVNVARINTLKVSRKERDWLYSVVLLVGMAVMILLGTALPMVRSIFGVEGTWEGTTLSVGYARTMAEAVVVDPADSDVSIINPFDAGTIQVGGGTYDMASDAFALTVELAFD